MTRSAICRSRLVKSTSCRNFAQSAMGPFYCPQDHQVECRLHCEGAGVDQGGDLAQAVPYGHGGTQAEAVQQPEAGESVGEDGRLGDRGGAAWHRHRRPARTS